MYGIGSGAGGAVGDRDIVDACICDGDLGCGGRSIPYISIAGRCGAYEDRRAGAEAGVRA